MFKTFLEKNKMFNNLQVESKLDIFKYLNIEQLP